MSLFKRGWPLLAILIFYSPFLLAQEVIQDFGRKGVVNWTQQIIKATGIGTPNIQLAENAQKTSAIESGKQNAIETILEILQQIPVSANQLTRDFLLNNSQAQSEITDIIRNFVVTDIRYLSTGDTEIDVELSLVGALPDLLLPRKFGGGQLFQITEPLCPCCGQPWPRGKPVPEGLTLIMPQNEMDVSSEQFTGIIVDARGLKLVPSFAPKIQNEAGDEIYGTHFADRVYGVEIGMVGFVTNLEAAKESERVRDNPLVVKAIGISGENNTDVVISNSDAFLIHGAANRLNFLERCRVIFVLDQKK